MGTNTSQTNPAAPQMVDFSRALLKYINPKKKPNMIKYRDAVKVYAKEKIPSLMAPQADWNQLFDKF